jgi:hypothetical protein
MVSEKRFGTKRKIFKASVNPDFLHSVLFGKQMLLPWYLQLALMASWGNPAITEAASPAEASCQKRAQTHIG